MSSKKNSLSKKASLETCRHCQHKLSQNDTQMLNKYLIKSKYGLYWMGLEKQFIVKFKVTCPSCENVYLIRSPKTFWSY